MNLPLIIAYLILASVGAVIFFILTAYFGVACTRRYSMDMREAFKVGLKYLIGYGAILVTIIWAIITVSGQ